MMMVKRKSTGRVEKEVSCNLVHETAKVTGIALPAANSRMGTAWDQSLTANKELRLSVAAKASAPD
jgi:hypothetical protein